MSAQESQLVPDFDSYAASRRGVPDFDSYVASKKSAPPQRTPSRAAPSAAAPASVNPRLDSFVNDVMGEASRRTGYTYKLGSGVRTPEEQAEKVAQGYSRTYDSKHLSGSARDVLAFDSRGNYITDGQHPAYKALGDAYRDLSSSSPVSVKWGGDFTGFYDPGHFELGEAAGQPSAQVPDFDEYVKAKSAVPDFDEYVAQKRADDDKPDVTINASAAPVATPLPSMPALPAQPAPDVMTTEGRAQRDALRAAESQPNARQWVDVRLPAGVRDWAQLSSNDVAKEGVRQWAAQRGIPSDFTEKWLADNGSDESLHLYDLATQKPLTTGEAMGREDIYDLNNRSFRLSAEMPQFKKLQDDYKLAQLKASGIPGMESAKSLDEVPAGLRALTVDADETSPGEKFLAGATPVAHAALRTADLATRPLQALDAGFWAKVRGARDPVAVMAAYQQFFGGNPELGKNVIAEGLRNSDRLRAINPRLPGLLGELANIVVEPSNLALIGGTAAASKLLGGAGRVGEAARGAGLLDRGFVEARPLGLGETAFGGSAGDPLHVLLRGSDGTNYLAHTGTGDVINLETGELVYEGGEPVGAAPHHSNLQLRNADGSFAEGEPLSEVKPGDDAEQLFRGLGPHAERDSDALTLMHADKEGNALLQKIASGEVGDAETANQFRAKAREFGVSEGTQDDLLRQSLEERRVAANGEQPLHEFLSDLTGRPAPDIKPDAAPKPGAASRVLNTASDIINAPKSIKSSLALHGTFRQGLYQIGAHPTFLQDAITQQAKAFVSESAFRDFAQGLTERPWFKPMQDAGLFLPSTYDVEMGGRAPAWLREERFASAAAERIPGVRASSRSYLAAMDAIRAQSVEHYLTVLYGSPEADLSKADPETLKALAEMVNVTTGRGVVPVLDRFAWGRQAVAAANNFLWSPRAMASRFNIVSPYRIMRGLANPATRPVALLQVNDSMRAALSVGATLSLLSLVPGVKVGLNPYKSGWGMVKVGNTQYDLLDGVPSSVKSAAQVGQAFYRHAEGKPPVTRHGEEQTVYNLTSDFLRKRLSPSAQVAAEAVTGKNATGEKVSGAQMASDLLTPFTLEEMYKAWVDAGGSSVTDTLDGNKEFKTGFKGAVKGLPSAVGVPSSTYTDRRRGGDDAEPSGEVLDSRSPSSAAASPEATPSADPEAERKSAGPPEVSDAAAAEVARFLDSLDDKQFSDFAKSLDETFQMGRAGEAADLAGEAAATGMSLLPIPNAPRYVQGAQFTRALRVLAREKRLRPAQFDADAASGRYGDAMREEMPERIYYPQNHFR